MEIQRDNISSPVTVPDLSPSFRMSEYDDTGYDRLCRDYRQLMFGLYRKMSWFKEYMFDYKLKLFTALIFYCLLFTTLSTSYSYADWPGECIFILKGKPYDEARTADGQLLPRKCIFNPDEGSWNMDLIWIYEGDTYYFPVVRLVYYYDEGQWKGRSGIASYDYHQCAYEAPFDGLGDSILDLPQNCSDVKPNPEKAFGPPLCLIP